MLRYVVRDLVRNPRRTVASVAGIALAVGLFSGVAFFVDSSSAQMTARAVAPVTLDMQAGLLNPLASPLTLAESVSPATSAVVGERITVTLRITNTAAQAAPAVKLSESLSASLTYVSGSTQRDGTPVADAADAAAGTTPVSGGLSLGTLAPGAATTVTYAATVASPLPAGGLSSATAQAAGDPAPVVANAPAVPSLAKIQAGIRAVAGVRVADPFASVDLPAGSVRGPRGAVTGPVTLMGFDPSYLQSFPLIQATAGQYRSGTSLLSQPTTDLVGGTPGSSISLTLPGRPMPLQIPVGATADFSRATPLFVSRNPDNQGEFVASPYVVAIDLSTFRDVVVPALRADAASTTPVIKAAPIAELHIGIDRALLASDPATALVTTQGLRRTIERVAPGDITVIDNLSDALTGAQKDSILAKVLFIFLGLPGVALAAYLSRYAGGLLAEAQRRERATLRARGLRPRTMLRALAFNTVLLALLGSIGGLGLGFGALAVLFSGLHGDTGAYLVSVGLSLAAAAVTTALALYLPARRALLVEVSEERRELEVSRPPAWLRYRLDAALLAGAAVVGLVTYLSGGYKPAPAAEAQSVSLSFYLLLAPAFLWVGATLLAVRGLLAASRRLSGRITSTSFRRRLVARTAALSVLRRPRAAASGIIALSLAIAFGISILLFVRTYQVEKLTDARFINGADVRVTPTAAQPRPATFADTLVVAGVRAVSPVISASVVVGTDKRAMVAIEPATFPNVAQINPSFLEGITPNQALAALASDPRAVLIDREIARTFNIQVGDQVRVQLPNPATGRSAPVSFRAVGLYTNFPGFPQGVDIVGSIAGYQATVPTPPTLYLLDTGGSDATAADVATALRSGPGRTIPLLVDTIGTAVNRDQSTLAALNIDGLGRLEGLYTVLLSALGMAIFVFGILLRRRKEHITLRALGMRMRHLVALIVGEATLVAVASIVLGGLVGTAMALLFVQILRPLFTIPPSGVSVPALGVSLLLGLVLVAAAASSLVAGVSLRRSRLVDVLREE